MPSPASHWPTKVATLALPSRETHVAAMVWPSSNGSLLLLAELNLALPARHELASEITTTLSQAWHGMADSPKDDLEQSLEQLVLELNPVLQSNERLWGNPLAPRYHLGLALVRGNQLALSTVGHVSAFVVATDHLTNIVAAAHGAQTHHHPKPVFSQLIGGEIVSNEVLLLATSSLFDYLSPEKLRQLMGGRAPGQGLRELEQVVTSLPHHPPLGAIALALASAAAAEGTQPSMERLLKTKSQTTSLLSPTVWTGLRSLFSRPNQAPVKPVGETADSEESISPPATEPNAGHVPIAPVRWYRAVRRLAAKLAWLRSRDTAKSTIAWWLEARLNDFRRLPKAKQVALIMAALILLAFCQNLVSSERARLAARGSERYNELVAQITERQAAAEGALIYHDDTRARELAKEAETLLQELPHGPASRQQQYQAMSQSLGLLWARLDRRIELTSLTPWATLPGNAPAGLASIGSSIFAFSQAGVRPIDPSGKPGDEVNIPSNFGNLTAADNEGSNLILRSSSGQLATYDAKAKKITTLANPVKAIDIAWYEGRLYLITPDPQLIMRTQRTGGTLAPPTKWLRAAQGPLSEAKSLTVDGSIYVALSNKVEKYVQGLKRDFELQPVNPGLQNLEHILTTGDGDYLYLAAPKDKRIIVYDKQGKLIVQLIFPSLTSISGFSADSANKLLYLLSGNSIYRLQLSDYVK